MSKFNASDLALPKLYLEPGRSIIGETGTTIYSIGFTKTMDNGMKYISVNGGMADNILPTLSEGEYYAVVANKMREAPSKLTKVVGKNNDIRDVLIQRINLPETQRGDILAILSTGAYNYPMACTYNRLPIPGMMLVKNGNYEWIVKPQSLEDVIKYDILPESLSRAYSN